MIGSFGGELGENVFGVKVLGSVSDVVAGIYSTGHGRDEFSTKS